MSLYFRVSGQATIPGPSIASGDSQPVLPVTIAAEAGALYEWVFGPDASSLKDLVSGAMAAQHVGTSPLSYGDAAVTTPAVADGIGLVWTNLLVESFGGVFKRPADSGNFVLIGGWGDADSTPVGGAGLVVRNGVLTATARVSTSTQISTPQLAWPAGVAVGDYFFVMIFKGSGVLSAKIGGGTLQTVSGTYAQGTGRQVCIGPAYLTNAGSSAYLNSVTCAEALIFNSTLSEANFDTHYASVKAKMANRSIVVK